MLEELNVHNYAIIDKLAVRAGRLAYSAGRIPKKMYASASSPIDGLVGR